MLRSEAIAIIKRGLGFRQTQDTAIIAALQAAQRIIETGRTLPESLQAFTVMTITPGSAAVLLPARFLRVQDVADSYYLVDGVQHFLPRKTYEEANTTYLTGVDISNPPPNMYPKVLVIRGRELAILYPIPTAPSLTEFILCYYRGEPILDAEIENMWLKYWPEYLIGLAGMQVAGNVRDKDALATFTTMYKAGQGSLLGEVVENEIVGRPLIMGRDN